MNIEEAIKVVRNMKFLGCKECVFDNDTKCIKENGEDCQEIAIETLLTAYEKEKEKNKNARERIEYYLIGNFALNNYGERNKELRKLEKVLEE